MPKAFRLTQVKEQEDRAQEREREGDVVAHARNRPFLRAAHQFDNRGGEVSPTGNAAEKEVAYDPPFPHRDLQFADHGRTSSLAWPLPRIPRSRMAIRPVRP